MDTNTTMAVTDSLTDSLVPENGKGIALLITGGVMAVLAGVLIGRRCYSKKGEKGAPTPPKPSERVTADDSAGVPAQEADSEVIAGEEVN
jgi:hypothetical protein